MKLIQFYNRQVRKEDRLIRAIQACENATEKLQQGVYKSGEAFPSVQTRQVFLEIQHLEYLLRRKLVQTQYEKKLLAHRMNRGKEPK